MPQPASGTAVSREEAREVAERIGYPVVVRPSYVLGGRGMAIVFDAGALDRYMTGAVDVSHDRPVLIDRFLEDAFEFDVDAVADATGAVVIGGIMEHIEEAGIHSGDSSCVVPPFMVAERHLATIREYTRRIARALKVVGLMNIQYAIKDDMVYVLEVNPRSSRTVPYISKATGVPMAKIAARVAAGRTLAELGLVDDLEAAGVFVKSPVFPFVRFPGVDTILGPEMKSTGEVMGGSDNFGAAFGKAMMGAGQRLPEKGCVFISVNNSDKQTVLPIARDLAQLGFTLAATRGTAAFLRAHGLEVEVMYKVNEGRPNVADHLVNRSIDMVINTPLGRDSFFDDRAVRRAATMAQVPCITTLTGASAAVSAIRALRQQVLTVRSLQDYYAGRRSGARGSIRSYRQTDVDFKTRRSTLESARSTRQFSALCVSCALSVLSYVAVAAQTAPFRARVDIVQVTVTVTDAQRPADHRPHQGRLPDLRGRRRAARSRSSPTSGCRSAWACCSMPATACAASRSSMPVMRSTGSSAICCLSEDEAFVATFNHLPRLVAEMDAAAVDAARDRSPDCSRRAARRSTTRWRTRRQAVRAAHQSARGDGGGVRRRGYGQRSLAACRRAT